MSERSPTSAEARPSESAAAIARREYIASLLLAFYKRVVSPMLHSFAFSQCKYLPTCSEYAYVAVVRHGWLRGAWLAARRLLRCHPLAKGGFDPVP